MKELLKENGFKKVVYEDQNNLEAWQLIINNPSVEFSKLIWS